MINLKELAELMEEFLSQNVENAIAELPLKVFLEWLKIRLTN